jgi:uncharacterized membrane protein YjgN (DUF898 family)
VGIRASYWATGGILAVLGLAIARVVIPLIVGMALAIGAFMLKAMLILFAVLVIWMVLRTVRSRRRETAETA